jgi:hypothetical protein
MKSDSCQKATCRAAQSKTLGLSGAVSHWLRQEAVLMQITLHRDVLCHGRNERDACGDACGRSSDFKSIDFVRLSGPKVASRASLDRSVVVDALSLNRVCNN